MLQGLTGWHLVVILFIILLLFGAPKLPGLAKSVGQSMKILKKEVRSDEPDARSTASAESAPGEQAQPVAVQNDTDAELARARAEAEAAKAELEALKLQAQAEKRDQAGA